jgi:hypothetical protein
MFWDHSNFVFFFGLVDDLVFNVRYMSEYAPIVSRCRVRFSMDGQVTSTALERSPTQWLIILGVVTNHFHH